MTTETQPVVDADTDDRVDEEPRLTAGQIWRELGKASFAVLGHVTPDGEPRTSGVVFKAVERRLYVVTAADSWKAKQIARDGRVSVTVPVRRGGGLAFLVPIPPATISFQGAATVYPPGSAQAVAAYEQLGRLLPDAPRGAGAVIEIVPEGTFVTYGVGVSLGEMRDPASARGRVPVGDEVRA